ncbi:uncharacterized protein SPSK_00353 [Sporothrix schenckii 1099-18]|uniref:EKC/KEOPS complex subunit GON7 n=1 Tax=Sporothrix schenckii 1099-18 TaxID=1397361 RepID=A0A0F2M2L7_SPOSC|nr:uncharacterized protein SPSK_00353 [Sporothrix schenckii 1099-18]KJR83938.1 hypothetical protein SPSK_00353 [Sporothrix schenckii 1099-18]
MPNPVLKAAYSAPDHKSFTASQELSAAPAASPTLSTADKTAYLAALRGAVTAVQDNVNRELTARMVIDAQAANQAAVDQAAEKEEQNYGEEVMDEDE